jgi:Flp pilus assembly pilin Flp
MGGAQTARGGNVIPNTNRLLQASEDDRESGQALVEYTLLLMCVALVAVTALTTIGVNILEPLSDVATGIGGA